MNNDEFDMDFLDDEDDEWYPDKESDDELLMSLYEAIQLENMQPQLLNIPRIKEFYNCYKIIQQLFPTSKVTYQLNDVMIREFGYIRVTDKTIEIRREDYPKLEKVINTASNFSVVPRTSGVVSMDFGFYGLTRIIEGDSNGI